MRRVPTYLKPAALMLLGFHAARAPAPPLGVRFELLQEPTTAVHWRCEDPVQRHALLSQVRNILQILQAIAHVRRLLLDALTTCSGKCRSACNVQRSASHAKLSCDATLVSQMKCRREIDFYGGIMWCM